MIGPLDREALSLSHSIISLSLCLLLRTSLLRSCCKIRSRRSRSYLWPTLLLRFSVRRRQLSRVKLLLRVWGLLRLLLGAPLCPSAFPATSAATWMSSSPHWSLADGSATSRLLMRRLSRTASMCVLEEVPMHPSTCLRGSSSSSSVSSSGVPAFSQPAYLQK